MKKFMRLLLSLLFVTGSYAADLEKRIEPPLQPQFSHIFELLDHSVATMAEANEFAQKNLLRRGERWDTQEETVVHKRMKEHEAVLLKELKSIAVLNFHQGRKDARESEITKIGFKFPERKQYDYALLMGALKDTTLVRLDYLAQLIKEGYTFNDVALLGGKRELLPEEKEGLPEHIQTEAEMMVHVYQEHPCFKNKKMLLIDAPMIKKDDGTLARPTTDSTLECFAQTAKENFEQKKEAKERLHALLGLPREQEGLFELQKPSCMVISNGQYIVRQALVAARILGSLGFVVEGDGPDAADPLDIVMLMDEFARVVYEANRYRQEELNKK